MSSELYQARNVSSVRLVYQGLQLGLGFGLLSCHHLPTFFHVPCLMHDFVRVRIRVRLYFILFYFVVIKSVGSGKLKWL